MGVDSSPPDFHEVTDGQHPPIVRLMRSVRWRKKPRRSVCYRVGMRIISNRVGRVGSTREYWKGLESWRQRQATPVMRGQLLLSITYLASAQPQFSHYLAVTILFPFPFFSFSGIFDGRPSFSNFHRYHHYWFSSSTSSKYHHYYIILLLNM